MYSYHIITKCIVFSLVYGVSDKIEPQVTTIYSKNIQQVRF